MAAPTRLSSGSDGCLAEVVETSACPSTGQNPPSSGKRRWHVSQVFNGRSPRRLPSAGRPAAGVLEVVQDTAAMRALLEILLPAELLEHHRRDAEVTALAGAVAGARDGHGAARADRLVAPVERARQLADDARPIVGAAVLLG